MNVDLIFRIAAIGIIVAVLNQLLVRSGREEQAMMVTLAGLITVLLMMVYEINTLFTTVKTVFGLTPQKIIRQLDLLSPRYGKTAAYGHFGRREFPWERADQVAALQNAVF